jgi:SAM-dependent methyltransferase
MRDKATGVLTRAVRGVKRWSGRARQPLRVELPLGARQAPDGLPLPPGRLMHLVAASSDPSWFLEGGMFAATSLRGILERNGFAIERLGAILDFGCGAGRVLRHWSGIAGPAFHGTDYNPELIAWCTVNLPFAILACNRLAGPLAYADSSFDLVYAFSVFTHLDEAGQPFWMGELGRVLKPGGLLFLTTHGAHYLPALSAAEQKAFRRGELVVRRSRRAGSNDCAAFHPESYARTTLARGFDVLEFVPEGARGNPWQDAYLLRKP